MNDTLLNNLAKQFESYKVVFWYDSSSEFSDQLDIMTDDVTLIRASEYNDFVIKYRLQPESILQSVVLLISNLLAVAL